MILKIGIIKKLKNNQAETIFFFQYMVAKTDQYL